MNVVHPKSLIPGVPAYLSLELKRHAVARVGNFDRSAVQHFPPAKAIRADAHLRGLAALVGPPQFTVVIDGPAVDPAPYDLAIDQQPRLFLVPAVDLNEIERYGEVIVRNPRQVVGLLEEGVAPADASAAEDAAERAAFRRRRRRPRMGCLQEPSILRHIKSLEEPAESRR